MPTTSTLSHFTFTNWGPLTTTWTPAASCSTLTDNVLLVTSSFSGNDAEALGCANEIGDCLPCGPLTTTSAKPTDYLGPPKHHLGYYSPGLYCPSGWDTVGIASRKGDADVTSQGILSPRTLIPTGSSSTIIDEPANVFMQILAPNETAALCCPS